MISKELIGIWHCVIFFELQSLFIEFGYAQNFEFLKFLIDLVIDSLLRIRKLTCFLLLVHSRQSSSWSKHILVGSVSSFAHWIIRSQKVQQWWIPPCEFKPIYDIYYFIINSIAEQFQSVLKSGHQIAQVVHYVVLVLQAILLLDIYVVHYVFELFCHTYVELLICLCQILYCFLHSTSVLIQQQITFCILIVYFLFQFEIIVV